MASVGTDNIALLEQLMACQDVLQQGEKCAVVEEHMPEIIAASNAVIVAVNTIVCPSGCWNKVG